MTPATLDTVASMNRLETFNRERDRLFGIAYRMLGSVHDAEDIVQEAYVRWEQTSDDTVENPAAFLCTVVTRMSIDLLRSARKRREEYVGEWLPEPLVVVAPPSDAAVLAESLSTAFLLMLERLNPVERAAFLLREVFDYGYPELAAVLGKSDANCRQIVRRARERVQRPAVRHGSVGGASELLFQRFMLATRGGDLAPLVACLAEDATLHSDHGGKATAARRTIIGAEKIARFFLGITRRFLPPDTEICFATINAAPGAIVYRGGVPETAFSAEIVEGQIQRIYVVRNPDKLRHLLQTGAEQA